MIKFKIPKIDSFRLIVPLSDVKVLDSKFMQRFVSLNLDSGEIDTETEHIKTSNFSQHNGIKLGFAMKNIYYEKKGSQVQCLIIGINAKMLKSNYFEGINKYTIETIFNYINASGYFKIEKEIFLNAKVTDVDFCIDFKLTNITCKDVFSICYELTEPSKIIKPNLFELKLNKGIEWGKRDDVAKAYKTKQFLKYYAKVLELMHNSTEFYDSYIKDKLNEETLFADSSIFAPDYNENNILRIETTIKNTDHFATYGIKCKTLIELLNIDLLKHNAIFNRPIQTYMSGYKTITHNSKLTLTERGWIYSLNLLAKSMNLKPIEVVDILVLQMFPFSENNKLNVLKSSRSQFKKKLIELVHIDKKTMIQNKMKNTQISMEEIKGFGLIPF